MWRGEDSGRGADISGRHCRGLPVALFACGRRVGETRAAESLVRYRVNLLSVKDKLRDPYPGQWQLAPRVPLGRLSMAMLWDGAIVSNSPLDLVVDHCGLESKRVFIVDPDYTIADAGAGLRAGQKLAWPDTPCHGDVFHIHQQFETLVNIWARIARRGSTLCYTHEVANASAR